MATSRLAVARLAVISMRKGASGSMAGGKRNRLISLASGAPGAFSFFSMV
ncbi:MAG: hypothetical protein ACD_54C01287G0001 [uncultured bacterium]|nr:MAG: hypothetical protein ACD_54C01287G0001 [uncultured bacterium]